MEVIHNAYHCAYHWLLFSFSVCKKWKTIRRNINAKQQKHLSYELYPMYKFGGCFVTCKYTY